MNRWSFLLLATSMAGSKPCFLEPLESFTIFQEGRAIGRAQVERNAQEVIRWSELEISTSRGAETQRWEERLVCSEFAGRPIEWEWTPTGKTGAAPLQGSRDGSRLMLHREGQSVPVLVGTTPFAIVDRDHALGLFSLADAVPRLPGVHRSFDVIHAASLQRQRVNGRFLGKEESRCRISLEGPEFTAEVLLGAAGEWRELSYAGRVWRRTPKHERVQEPFRGPTRTIEFAAVDGVRLEGTFRQGTGDLAVLLIAGSGVLDRNGNGVNDRPPRSGFLGQLAESLSREGLSTLTYDQGELARGEELASSVSRRVSDASAALHWLADQRPKGRVVVLGHSEGARIAVRLGAADVDRRISGLVLLGAPLAPLREVVLAQTRAVLTAQSVAQSELTRLLAEQQAFLDAVVTGSKCPSAGGLDRMGSVVWWQEHLAFSSRAELARLEMPLAIFHGQRDLLVLPKYSTLDAIQEQPSRLRVVFSGVDHWFMPSANGDPLRMLESDRRLDPRLPTRIVAWAHSL